LEHDFLFSISYMGESFPLTFITFILFKMVNFNHQPDMHTFFLRGFLDRISPQKMRWFGACETIARATQGRCSRGGLHAVVFAAGATGRSDLGNLEKNEDLIGNSWWWNRSKS
jgi:hypothetical protein